MSADWHHRNSINVRISDFAPVFWIAARIKRLTLLDHVASWRSPEGGRAYWRTSGIVVGGNETASARQKRSEKERKTAGRSARGRRGERERQPRRERGGKGGEKGQGEDGQEDEGGTKYRRRTAVGIKRGDGRRCGGPTLFPVEDWTALPPPLRRPSCPPTSSFLPSSCSFFSSSPFCASECACDNVMCVCVLRVLLSTLAYLISYFLTRVLRAHASAFRRAMSARPLVAPDDAATRHAARPRTMLDRIILAGPLC